ncbi:MAG: hypothetical protein FWH26_02030 [Oscillospiraceae bacterium]|nr:hypothetical protein [Oscillospiraceae bacterium]
MMSHDYFIQTQQMLIEGKRFKEAIDLCEYAIESAVWPTPMTRQCGALCRWNLAETYFYAIGDAKSARDGYIAFLQYVDDDMSMLTIPSAPTLQEAMEDMYVKTCDDMGQLAISYDEYFYYIHKSESVRPLTQKAKNQLEAMEYNRNHGLSWSDNIVQLAELEAESVESNTIDRLPNAVALYSLFLLFPDEIDPTTDTLRIAIKNYSSCVCRLVGESILCCAAKGHPANPDNYRFIFEQAIALVSEYLNDMETHDAATEARDKLVSARSESIDKSNFYNYGYASIAPPGVQDFIPPLVLKEQIRQNLSNPGRAGLPKTGCLPVLLIPILSFGGIIAAIVMLLMHL